MVTGVRPEQYLDLAALRGDASDNLPGVQRLRRQDRGQAARSALDTAAAAFDDARDGGERCRAAVGRARATVAGHARRPGPLRRSTAR